MLHSVQALEVLLVAIAGHAELIQVAFETVQIVTAEASAEEAAGQAGPGEERRALRGVPGARLRVGGAADGDAVLPRFLHLVGQAEVGAAGHERREPVFVRVFIRRLEAGHRPVGAAEGADAARVFVLVEHLDDGADRHVGVVPVEQVEVDVVELEAGQRIVDVGRDVEGGDAAAVAAVVRALADDDHVLAHAPVAHPRAHGALVVAVAVNVAGIKGRAPQRAHAVQQRETLLHLVGVDHDSALHQARDGLVHARNRSVFHGSSSFVW